MKAVVDTNVVAYLLLGTEAFAGEAKACFNTVSNPIAPAHWEAELANVVWMAVRAGILPQAEGPVRLGLARRLGVESVATPRCARAPCSDRSPREWPSTTRCSWNWRSERDVHC